MSNLDDAAPSRSQPFTFYAICGLALVLYVAVLASTVAPNGGGEALIAAAIGSFFAVLALWIVLAIALAIGGVMGEMPRWAAITLVPLHVLSGVAMVAAIDMISRHHGWGMVFPIALPLLTAFYASYARLQALREKLPPQTGALTLTAICALSATALLAAT